MTSSISFRSHQSLRPAALVLGLCLALGATSPAWAHARLRSSAPAAGATVTAAPTEVRLTYGEPVEAAFCKATLTRAGHPVAAGKVTAVAGQPDTVVLPLAAPAAPGAYALRWTAVGRDGHRTQGHFAFTVK